MAKLITQIGKKIIKKLLKFLVKSKFGSKVITESSKLDVIVYKNYKNNQIKLIQKNFITKYRNETIFTKEPETIVWIKRMQKDSVFWDVGANIGLYSILAALTNSKNVVAFEPSYFNLSLLAKNIYNNNLSQKIIIIPISLSNKNSIDDFNLTSTEEGGALSTFGRIKNKNNFRYKTLSYTLNKFLEDFTYLKPDYLKIDVDGIETSILMGGNKVLENLKSILVESNSKTDENQIIEIMLKNNFYLESKDIKNSNLIFNKIEKKA